MQKRSASVDEAEARVRPQHELLGEARQVHHRRARRRPRIRSRSRDRTPRRASSSQTPSKPSSRATRARSIGKLVPASAAAPSGSRFDALAAIGEALAVAREHRVVGEQVMAERHRLRDLQVREARHDRRRRARSARSMSARRSAASCARQRVDRAAQPQPHVGRDLVVARARRCAAACRRRRRARSGGCSMLRWTSSRSSDHANVPARDLGADLREPALDVGEVAAATGCPRAASIRACASEPSMSASARRRSNSTDAVKRLTSSADTARRSGRTRPPAAVWHAAGVGVGMAPGCFGDGASDMARLAVASLRPDCRRTESTRQRCTGLGNSGTRPGRSAPRA